MRTVSGAALLHRWIIAVGLVLATGAALDARPLDSAITKADIDPSASQSWQNGKAKAVEADVLLDVLGLGAKSTAGYLSAGGIPAEGAPASFRYVVAFKRPITAGSILVQATGQRLGLLKSDAKFPPDARDESAWSFPQPVAGQSGAVLYTLPAGTSTRALLVADDREAGGSYLHGVTVFKERWQNVTPAALAYAGREYTAPRSPNTYSASHVTSGTGAWVSSGPDSTGRVSTPDINDINPEWFMLAWSSQPQLIRAVWLDSNIETLTIDTYNGPDSVNPRAGTASEWRTWKKLSQHVDRGRWIVFDEPVRTRGLRLNILKTDKKNPRVATIQGLHVLSAAADQPAPDATAAAGADSDLPPFRFPYKLGAGSNMTMVVNDADGKRARNLLARQPVVKGAHEQAWDLRDEAGNFVSAGDYKWQAITWPQLETTYEFTIYPNVSQHSPDNPPWMTGLNGPGGWMADHTPPIAVCTAGDRVYLGSLVAESGVSFIECDLTGKKLWAHHSFAAWTGPRYLASDGKTVFVGGQVMGETPDTIWGVDIESKQVRQVMAAPPTAERKRGMKGLSVHAGKLAMSIDASDDWLANAMVAEDVDLAACYPLYRPARKPRVAYEVVPKPQEDFLRLFRLTGVPPGMGLQGSLTVLHSQQSASPRQHIMLAFRRPVPLGSVVLPTPTAKDVRVELSVLKPGAPYPPNLDDAKQWIPFAEQPSQPWEALPAPSETMTRALRITLVKGQQQNDDLLTETAKNTAAPALDVDSAKPVVESALTEFGTKREGWMGQLEGVKLLRRRFSSVREAGEIRVNSGKVARDGSWDAERKQPLTGADPAIYAIQWKTPQQVRGMAIKEVDGKTTKIDVYAGAANGPIDIEASDGWETVGEYQPARRSHWSNTDGDNHGARYMDGYVDFGRQVETRAVRLRVIEQWADNGQPGIYGARADLGGQTIDPARCRVFGVTPLTYLGGEPPLDPLTTRRVEIYDVASGQLEQQLPIEQPGQIAYHPSGSLLAFSGKDVVKLATDGGQNEVFVGDLEKPTDLAFDAGGQLYVFDAGADRQNVRVYNAAGKLVRSIGKPGGLQTGAWDPERMGQVTDIDLDHTGQLWVVENQYFPKRITVWTKEGKFKKEFLGNTPYGGGGVLDPWDKSRAFYGPLEFAIDWKTGQSRLKNLTWQGATPAGEIPIRIDSRTYLVTRPHDSLVAMQCGIVYLYQQDHLKMVAAVGPAAEFEPLKSPEMIARLGGKALKDFHFRWSDLNDNGKVDFEEVVLSPKVSGMLTNFNRDLGIQSGQLRFKVKEFSPSGVPIYEEEALAAQKGGNNYRLDDGNFFRLDGSAEAVSTPTGQDLWTYPAEGVGVLPFDAFHPWNRGQVVSEFGYVGHETAPQGDLGEFIVINTNLGAWNIWTHDGLLVGPLFRDLRDPLARPWSMTQHERGMLLKDVTVGQEHFSGYLCRTLQDNKFYAIAGHNHMSVLEVHGLDKFVRTSGTLKVTSEDLQRAQQWTEQHEQRSVYERAPVVDAYLLAKPPQIDGKLSDWESASASMNDYGSATFYLGYDETHLYLAYATAGMGPLKNTGTQWDRMFKSGACVDLQLATDPEADPDRTAPEEGDVRLLMSYMHDKPIAVLYRGVVPGATKEQQWRVVSPTGEVTFDEVAQLKDVVMARSETLSGGYIVEAAVPLAGLGLKPAPGMRLKLDWGVLVSGPDGHEVFRRVYWANKATNIVADAPTEARLSPHLWGHVRFMKQNQKSSENRLDSVEINPSAGKKGKELAKDVDDILETLEDAKR